MSNTRRQILVAVCAALFVVGCDRSIGARILGSSHVEIGDVTPEDLKKDSFTFRDARINSATLELTVVSGGGCQEHTYSLTMTPAAFMESYPVQANLYLRHDAHDDPCDAIVTDTVEFDLGPIIALYKQMYGSSGQVNLNLYNFEQTESTRLVLQVE